MHLAKKGHSIVVFCNNINTPLLKKLFTGIANVTVVAFSKKNIIKYALAHPAALLKKDKGSRNDALMNNARLHYISSYKPDIVHIEFSGLGILYLPVLKKLTPVKVVSCRGSAEKVKLLVSDERKEATKQLFAEVDAIHCVSGDMMQTILPYCPDASKVFINFPSIDATIFKRTIPYKQNKPVSILSIGRFTFQKGYFTGLQAIKKLTQHFTGFVWNIIGDGAQREEIIFHINQMGLQNYVHLAGPKGREDILAAYNTATIFFLPSVYEGIANVVLEAMSMELPVVATKSGGMEEVITHGYNGMLADVYDADVLADCLLQLITNHDKSRQMGVLARQRIQQQFTIETQAGIFDATYQKLLTK